MSPAAAGILTNPVKAAPSTFPAVDIVFSLVSTIAAVGETFSLVINNVVIHFLFF